VEVAAHKAVDPYLNTAFCSSGGYTQKLVKLQVGGPAEWVAGCMPADLRPPVSSCESLQIDVTVGSRRFLDDVLWDAHDPLNTPEGYASAVSQALGLNWHAARLIKQAVQEQLRTAPQVCPYPHGGCQCPHSI